MAREAAGAAAPPARGWRALFWAVALLLPVAFFSALEGGLRLAGYGADYPLFVDAADVPGWRVQNREVARRYFAHQKAVPNSLPDYFRAEPDSSVYRIVVQGGSSAAGYPFYHSGSFSRALQQRLQQTFPDRNIEVINTAMAAVNSYTLLDLADEVVGVRPDAVLLYAGHNEFYGALGVGSTESLGRWPAVVRLYLRLQRLRTVQLVRDAMAALQGALAGRPAGEAPSSTLMGRMVGESTIAFGSPLFEAGVRQFRSNLRALLETYGAAGVPVYVGTLASNERDHRPFVTVTRDGTDGAAHARLIAQVERALARGDTAAARGALRQALRDTLAADAAFLQGRLAEAAGDYDAARRAYLRAKDLDGLRFRAPEAFNAVIRAEAARAGATVVEVQQALRDAAPRGLIGGDLMMEHLHPTLEGYFLVADAFYGALQEAQAIGPWTTPVPRDLARTERLVTPLDSLVGVLRVRRLMSEWPFVPRGTVGRGLDTLAARTPVDRLALEVYRNGMPWHEATSAYADSSEARGDLVEALRARFTLIQAYPFASSVYAAAGNTLLKAGRGRQAQAYFEAAVERDASSGYAYAMAGALRLQHGDRAGAIRFLERARELLPEDVRTLYNLSGAYALEGRYDDARQTAEALLRLRPDHPDARRLLASLPHR